MSDVKGRGQGHFEVKVILRSRSKVKFKMSFFYWRGVVDIGTWLRQVQQKVQ